MCSVCFRCREKVPNPSKIKKIESIYHRGCNRKINRPSYDTGPRQRTQAGRSGKKVIPLNRRGGEGIKSSNCVCVLNQNPNLCIQMILDMGVLSRWAGLSYTKSDHHPMLLTEAEDNTTPACYTYLLKCLILYI